MDQSIIEGVREYWLLDPQTRQAEFLQLGADGRYHPMPLDADGIFRSQVLSDWWLRVDWLWEGSRPGLVNVLREWKLI